MASAIPSAIRKRWRLRTVPGRLTFWYVGTLAASLIAFAAFVLLVRAGSLRAELDADLSSRAVSLAADITPLLDRADLARWLSALPGMSSIPLTIRRGDGSVAFRSASVPALAPDGERTLAQGAVEQVLFQTVSDARQMDQRVVNRFVTSPAGSAYAVQLMGPEAAIDRGIRELAAVQAVAILLVLCAARYGSALTARRALAPIDEIIRRGRDIHGHELGERLDVKADTVEIEQLVQSLNQMLARLEEPMQTAHRFAANVSHELQTPIAAMRFALEAAQRADRPPEHFAAIATDLLADLDRVSSLIRDLRLLALAGAGQLIARHERFDLGETVQQCCEIARAAGESRNVRVDEHIEPGITAAGSALHFRRAILNLTNNAIRYTAPDSTVTVRLTFADGAATITVADRGCGISAADLPKIFEPFFRTDRARARETGGSGLGLAIADQVVRAHRGRISVSSELNQGTTFTVHVPAAASPARHS